MSGSMLRPALRIGLLAAVYLATGTLRLSLDPVGGFATLVWAPAGIALAVLLLFGLHLWPGVTLGALLVNLNAGAPAAVAVAIAVGSTSEAVLGAYLLRRVPWFRPSLDRVRAVLALIVVGAGVAVVGATVGTSSLLAVELIPRAELADTWNAWWLGDVIGIVVVAPLLLVWGTARRRRYTPARAVEAAVLGLGLAAASVMVFGRPPPTGVATHWREFVLPSFLIWAALRFELRGAATAIFVVSTIAVWGTVIGRGPFTGAALFERLRSL